MERLEDTRSQQQSLCSSSSELHVRFSLRATCRDGWQSASIGRRGACSHHGGVGENGWAMFVTLLSLGGAFAVFAYLSSRQSRSSSQPRPLSEAPKLQESLRLGQKLRESPDNLPSHKTSTHQTSVPFARDSRIEAEAEALISQFGVQAYRIARSSEQEAKTPELTARWRRVALAIARRTRGRIGLNAVSSMAADAENDAPEPPRGSDQLNELRRILRKE